MAVATSYCDTNSTYIHTNLYSAKIVERQHHLFTYIFLLVCVNISHLMHSIFLQV